MKYKILVSSANNLTVLLGSTLPMSFAYIKKSSGPKTEPCGTPQVTHKDEEYASILLSVSKIMFDPIVHNTSYTIHI